MHSPGIITLYANLQNSIVYSHHLNHCLYEDDSQIYIAFFISEANYCSVDLLIKDLYDIFHWMTESRFKLNSEDIINFFLLAHRGSMKELRTFSQHLCLVNLSLHFTNIFRSRFYQKI